MIAAGTDLLFSRVMKVLGRPELAADPRFRTNPDRVAHWQALQHEIENALAARDSADWLGPLEEEGVPCAPLNDVADVMANPQVAARNMIVTAHDPDLGPLKMQGNPIKMSTYDDPATRSPAPDLDADRRGNPQGTWAGIARIAPYMTGTLQHPKLAP